MPGAALRLEGESVRPQRPSGCPQSRPRRPSTGPGGSEKGGLTDPFYAGIRAFTWSLEGQGQLTRSEWPRQGTAGTRAEVLKELEVWRTLGSLSPVGALCSECLCQNDPGHLLKRFRVAPLFGPELHIQWSSGLYCQLRAVTLTTQGPRLPVFTHFHSSMVVRAKHIEWLIYAKHCFQLTISRAQTQAKESIIQTYTYNPGWPCMGAQVAHCTWVPYLRGLHSYCRHGTQNAQECMEF